MRNYRNRFAGPSIAFACCIGLFASSLCSATDWNRFRGPNGTGISPDKEPTPVEWSEKKNLKWKFEMPGPGSSSPIVVGDKIFVTCWTGYGTDRRNPGEQKNLKRHLVCVDRNTGKELWNQSVEALLPEDRYGGMFAENGYATHTPVSDGEAVYAFFGKTGVVAFDMDGKELWRRNVGKARDPRQWGSASSPILFNDKLIVPAAIENNSIVALDKKTGKVVWEEEADGFAATWSTPILVEHDGKVELVIGVPYEIWAFDPDTGKFKWYCESIDSSSMCASVVANNGIVYAVGGRNGGSIAVKAGGKDDVSKSHTQWTGRDRARIGTPIVHDGLMYWVGNRIATCVKADDGTKVYQERLPSSTAGQRSNNDGQGRDSRGSRGGSRRRGGGSDYASIVAADGKIYHTSRNGAIYVYKMGEKFELLATNRFESDSGDFSATPAISKGDIFIRSSKFLYCVGESK